MFREGRTNQVVLSRRAFIRGASAVTLSALLAGCVSPVTPAQPEEADVEGQAPSQEKALIQYWTGWGNYAQIWDELKTTDEYVQIVGDSYDIEVKQAEMQALLTALASGLPPDGMSNYPYVDFMTRGVLLPIDDWVANSQIVKEDQFIAGNWTGAFYQGVMYGVPANECFVRNGLNYNVKMVEEAGLDPDSPPHTWSECLEWHKALTKFDDSGNILQIGLDPYDEVAGWLGNDDGWFVSASWGWKWFDADNGKFDLNNERMAESFDVMGEFYKIAGPDNMAGMRQVEGQGMWGGSYNSEVQAMIIAGYWHPGETMIQKPEVGEFNRATWAPVPDSREGVKFQAAGGQYVMFFKDAKQTEGMFKAAEFLNTPTACDIIFKGVGWLPALTSYIETVDPNTYPGLEFYFQSVKEAEEWYRPLACPITDFAYNQWASLREAVYRDQMTATDAAAEFQKRCEEEYIAAGFG